MRAEVVLVRHAESSIPSPHGPDDYRRSLTDAGFVQAERLVEGLLAIKPSLIVSSPYLRAIQTVEPIAHTLGMPVETEHGLREWDSGLEPSPDYARHYATSWADLHFARPGGESLQQLTERAAAILSSIARQHQNRTVIVGSHGTFIARTLAGFGMSTVDWSFSQAMPMPAIYRFRFTQHGVRTTGPGISAHD